LGWVRLGLWDKILLNENISTSAAKISNLGYSSYRGRNFIPLESLNIYKMGGNGKVVFVADVLALGVVFEGVINIINSTIAMLFYNPTKQFRTS
jgi:hypothetical protein